MNLKKGYQHKTNAVKDEKGKVLADLTVFSNVGRNTCRC